jgi:hypothetical protein
MVDSLGSMFPAQTIAVTMGGAGSVHIHRGRVHREPLYPAVEVGRVGTGDAFASGFLPGCLEGKDWPECLKNGDALVATKYSIPGDPAITIRDELNGLTAQGERADIERQGAFDGICAPPCQQGLDLKEDKKTQLRQYSVGETRTKGACNEQCSIADCARL